MSSDDERVLLRRIAEALEAQHEIAKKLLWEAQYNRKTQDVVRQALVSPMLDRVSAFAAGRQLGFLETVTRIRDDALSFVRFGDGELRTMLRAEYQLSFQPNSPELAACLAAALTPAEGLLVGFPHVYRDVHWSGVWADIWGQVEPMVSRLAIMGNSHVTRPIYFQVTGRQGVDAWRSVWAQRTVTVVTGRGSRFELIPELFDNVAGSRFVYSTPTDAFSDLPRVRAHLVDDEADIILVALGPAGTVLTSQLAKAGKRAIDIGHISDSYANVFQGGEWPESKPVTTS